MIYFYFFGFNRRGKGFVILPALCSASGGALPPPLAMLRTAPECAPPKLFDGTLGALRAQKRVFFFKMFYEPDESFSY